MFGRFLTRFVPLSSAEEILLSSVNSGKPAVLQTEKPNTQSEENTIRADFLAFLAIGGDATSNLSVREITLQGACIKGELRLENTRTSGNFRLKNCHFDEKIEFEYATISGAFEMIECKINGFHCFHTTFQTYVFINDILIHGDIKNKSHITDEKIFAVAIEKSRIKGSFSFSGRIEDDELIRSSALIIRNSSIGADVIIGNPVESSNDVAMSRPISISNATIEGDLRVTNLTFAAPPYYQNNPEANNQPYYAIHANNIKILKNFLITRNVKVLGRDTGGLYLRHTEIGGNFEFSEATLYSPIGDKSWLDNGRISALMMTFIKIGGNLMFDSNFTLDGVLYMFNVDILGILDFQECALTSNGSIGGELNHISSRVFVFRKIKNTDFPIRIIGSSVHSIAIDLKSLGKSIDFDGFTYSRISDDDSFWTAERWIKLLEKQFSRRNFAKPKPHDKKEPDKKESLKPTFRPQPWMQLRKVLIEEGDYANAREIAIEFEKRRRSAEHEQQKKSLRYLAAALQNGRFKCRKSQGNTRIWRIFAKINCAYVNFKRRYQANTRYRNAAFQYYAEVTFSVCYNFLTRFNYKLTRIFYLSIIMVATSSLFYTYCASSGVFVPSKPIIYLQYHSNKKFSTLKPSLRCRNWTTCKKIAYEYPKFHPFLYSLNNFLPMVNLGQQTDWQPTEKHFPLGSVAVCWIILEKLSGWVFSLLLVASLSMSLKRYDE